MDAAGGGDKLDLKSADAFNSSVVLTPATILIGENGAASDSLSIATSTLLNGKADEASGVKIRQQPREANCVGSQLRGQLSASMESKQLATTGNGFAASVTCLQVPCGTEKDAVDVSRRLELPRRESVSGEIPVQVSKTRQTRNQQYMYYGQPSYFAAGDQSRYRYQSSREQWQQNGRMYFQTYTREQEEEFNLQRGTVYASDHQYSFRLVRSILNLLVCEFVS